MKFLTSTALSWEWWVVLGVCRKIWRKRAPIELNVAAFQLYEDALKKGDTKNAAAAATNILSTITNEYMEDFGEDVENWGNGEFGGAIAQGEIFYGLVPGIIGIYGTVDSNFAMAKDVMARQQKAVEDTAKRIREDSKKPKKD